MSEFPEWRVMPELQQPPKHELKYWLDPRTTGVTSPETDSALRTMAQNFGARRGAAAASIGWGISLAVAAVTHLLTANSAPWLALWLGLGAAALFALGWFFWRRVNAAPPPVSYQSTGRASTSLAGGWLLGAFMAIFLCLIAHVMLQPQLDSTARGIIAYAGYQLSIIVGCLSVFMLPGYFSQHARVHLRRLIDTDPGIRAELESLSLSWVDPVGTRSFGPL